MSLTKPEGDQESLEKKKKKGPKIINFEQMTQLP